MLAKTGGQCPGLAYASGVLKRCPVSSMDQKLCVIQFWGTSQRSVQIFWRYAQVMSWAGPKIATWDATKGPTITTFHTRVRSDWHYSCNNQDLLNIPQHGHSFQSFQQCP